MRIWVDADACPRVIKDIIFRASERLNIPVCLVVDEGFDVADDYIVDNIATSDLVITADIPLAARIVSGGGIAVDPRGEIYTEENVGERLSIRDLMMELRSGGYVQGGPPPFSNTDKQRFAASLDSLLSRILRGQRPV
jgi:uncharacterized protein YaiI (UPF0178 family)